MKQQEIVKMFDEIAPTYDLVNKVVSFGVDKKWREEAVKEVINIAKPQKVLDIACGTGDMIEIIKKYNVEICGVDPSKGMLEVAKKRFKDVKFYNAYATDIPLEDCADVITISFGIRNVLEIQKAINEFYKVLKKDGYVLVLEFIKAEKHSLFRDMVDLYSNKILPKIGGVISKNTKAYEYLPNSIENFYTKSELVEIFKQNQFELVKYKEFNFSQVGMFIFKKK